jgi:hypothetical protein
MALWAVRLSAAKLLSGWAETRSTGAVAHSVRAIQGVTNCATFAEQFDRLGVRQVVDLRML